MPENPSQPPNESIWLTAWCWTVIVAKTVLGILLLPMLMQASPFIERPKKSDKPPQ